MNGLGALIKRKREELGLSQEELARILGYKHKSSINKIELGLADVPRPKMPAFAKALGMNVIDFSGWSDERARLSFSYCMEQQMVIQGYNLLYSTEGDIILTHDGAEYELTEQSLKEMEEKLRFCLNLIVSETIQKSRKIGG